MFALLFLYQLQETGVVFKFGPFYVNGTKFSRDEGKVVDDEN